MLKLIIVLLLKYSEFCGCFVHSIGCSIKWAPASRNYWHCQELLLQLPVSQDTCVLPMLSFPQDWGSLCMVFELILGTSYDISSYDISVRVVESVQAVGSWRYMLVIWWHLVLNKLIHEFHKVGGHWWRSQCPQIDHWLEDEVRSTYHVLMFIVCWQIHALIPLWVLVM
jgi:hypothetical protein